MALQWRMWAHLCWCSSDLRATVDMLMHCPCRRNRRPGRPKSLRIYEAHVGMAGEDEKVSTYAEFRDNVLPRIKAQGYTAIQLMAIQVIEQ